MFFKWKHSFLFQASNLPRSISRLKSIFPNCFELSEKSSKKNLNMYYNSFSKKTHQTFRMRCSKFVLKKLCTTLVMEILRSIISHNINRRLLKTSSKVQYLLKDKLAQIEEVLYKIQLFHDGDHYHIKTSVYMIGTSVVKELNLLLYKM